MSGAATVEVMGPWLRNKGDVLNLWSVAERMGGTRTLVASSNLGLDRLPQRPAVLRAVWPPDAQASRDALRSRSPRALLGLLRDVGAARLAPRRLLRSRGLGRGRDVSVLLDCSGYAYGDVWSVNRVRAREAHYARLKRQGAHLVMLPQALGPFEKPEVREATARLLRLFDLLFVRDRVSLDHLRELDLDSSAAEIVPDITHLLEGEPPTDAAVWRSRVCIVPNARMTDRTDQRTADHYADFLIRAVGQVRERGLEPVLLIHESNDLPLAERIRASLDVPAPIVDEDARVTKGILGTCYAVIGSRYHAIVSALSQGTPVLGTSWSHKYVELFADYECPECLISPADPMDRSEERIAEFLVPERREVLHRLLSARAMVQKEKVERMWQRIEAGIA